MFINPSWKDLETLKSSKTFRVVATKNKIAIADGLDYTHNCLKMAMGLRDSTLTTDLFLQQTQGLLLVVTFQRQVRSQQKEDELLQDLSSILGSEVKRN